MPRAVVAVAYGGPEVVEVIDVPHRDPGPGEVVIAVRAAALNPSDLKTAAGLWGADPAKLPRRLGAEAAGVVTAVGPDGDGTEAVGADGARLAVGDEVVAFRVPGALASELTAPARDVLLKPASLGFAEASGLLLVGATAVHALEAVGAGEGDTVLVHGAGGSVGRVAIQLARLRGARVIATASPARHDELRELGAEPVAYGPGLLDRVRALGGEVTAAIDTVGTDEALEVSLALLVDPARLVTIANHGPVIAAGGTGIGGGPGADPGTGLRNAARPELVRLAGEGRISVPVVREYPLEQARAAFSFLAEGHAGGKVVLVP